MSDPWDKLKFPSQPVREYAPDWNRIVSGVLALLWLTLCAVGGAAESVLRNLLTILLPLLCIWFPEELGSLKTTLSGPISGMPISRGSPGYLVRLFGWIAFFALTVIRAAIMVTLRP